MGWISPDSHNDPSSAWSTPAYAYDESTGTRSIATTEEEYLELIVTTPISCDKVRIYSSDYEGGYIAADLDIDVYYSSAWHNIWSGVVPSKVWTEKTIGSTETVSKARICFHSVTAVNHSIWEFEFNELPPPPAGKTLVQAALISIAPLIVLPTVSQILKFAGG